VRHCGTRRGFSTRCNCSKPACSTNTASQDGVRDIRKAPGIPTKPSSKRCDGRMTLLPNRCRNVSGDAILLRSSADHSMDKLIQAEATCCRFISHSGLHRSRRCSPRQACVADNRCLHHRQAITWPDCSRLGPDKARATLASTRRPILPAHRACAHLPWAMKKTAACLRGADGRFRLNRSQGFRWMFHLNMHDATSNAKPASAGLCTGPRERRAVAAQHSGEDRTMMSHDLLSRHPKIEKSLNERR